MEEAEENSDDCRNPPGRLQRKKDQERIKYEKTIMDTDDPAGDNAECIS